jgi:cytochrome c oxidase subunit 1
MNINYLIHNTIWVPGHFHLTVGTAFALTAMAITYWLLPQLLGKRLRWRKLAAVQPFLWFLGMTLMSNAMHRAGLIGVPRRTAEPQYESFGYEDAVGGIEIPGVVDISAVQEMRIQIAIGGTILFIALAAFLAVVARTWIAARTETEIGVDSTIPAPLSGPEHSPAVLDRIWLWAAVALLLVAIAYGLPVWDMLSDGVLEPGAPPVPV